MSIHIALGDYNLDFTDQELTQFKDMWKEEWSVNDIAKRLKRDTVEIIVLVMDQWLSNQIAPRNRGIF
ncbi:hypothetical protein [Piscibacillus salipiscarius]|uniref:Helix-turn-helix domain containing protein n=1 Tax=Piscibacillus salipiscarius TaxID=299480 RepID=A0ABW5Q925_9BACI|nr:hypothetical protein [Piscibacillus salipiscarius]